jgi:hypothetical protein
VGSVLVGSARSSGQVFGVLLVLGLVGWGILRLGQRAKIRRPLAVVAVVVAVGFILIAAGVSASRGATVGTNPCARIGMTTTQTALVQSAVRRSVPLAVRRSATMENYYFCAAVPYQGHFLGMAFHVPIPWPGHRAALRMVLGLGSKTAASSAVAAIRSDPQRFLRMFGQTDPSIRVATAKAVRAYVVVSMTEMRRN